MSGFRIVGLMTIASVVVGQSVMNPCSDHTVIDNPKRSSAYGMLPMDLPIHDWYIVVNENWYRFQFYGTDVHIPELPPGQTFPSRQCGTQSPIWINGTHSHPTDSLVTQASVCTSYGLSKCDWNATIDIQKCSTAAGHVFYVYKLARPESVSMAYCAGHQTPCTPEQIFDPILQRCMDFSTTTSTTTRKPTIPIRGTSIVPGRPTLTPDSSSVRPHDGPAPMSCGKPPWFVTIVVGAACWLGGMGLAWLYFVQSQKGKISPGTASTCGSRGNSYVVADPLPYDQEKSPMPTHNLGTPNFDE